MKHEKEGVWSVVVTLDRGCHTFCFLIDGKKLVLSSRHKTRASNLLPGLTQLNWRNIYGGRPTASQSASTASISILKEFLSGVGVISVHDDSEGLPSLQGRLSFPSAELSGPRRELGIEALKAKDLVMHLRVPILLLYMCMLYFCFVGLAVLSRFVVWE